MPTESRTQFAMAAMDFATLFNSAFEQKSIGGFSLKLTAPEGPSTGGGVQARQHMTLHHAGANLTVVVGSCNTVEKSAELRTFDVVSAQFAQRYHGQKFPIGQADFIALKKMLSDFFTNQSFSLQAAEPPKTETAMTCAQPKSSSATLVIGIVVFLALVAAGVVYFVFLR